MNKKFKNITPINIVYALALIAPIGIVLFTMLCTAIGYSGGQTTTYDFMSTIPTIDFSKVNILGINDFNSWLFENVIKIESDCNDLIKWLITTTIFQLEWTIFITIVKIFIDVILFLPKALDKMMNRKEN
jgi:hypothetical protein